MRKDVPICESMPQSTDSLAYLPATHGGFMKNTLLILIAACCVTTAAAAATPDACSLFTAKDAAVLAGQAVSVVPGSSPTMCRYHGAGGPGSLGIEVHVKVLADAASAHAQFPTWVVPFPGSAGPTVTEVKNLGDEAAIVRNSIMSGVNFRRGAVLIKIGVHPPLSGDASLKVAASAVVGRL
jgi:hypothetical protein